MQCNVGGIDRIARVIAGLAVIGAGIAFQSYWGALGAVLVVTGVFGWCPLYLPMKLNTCKR